MLETGSIMLLLIGATIGTVAVIVSEVVLAHFDTRKYDLLNNWGVIKNGKNNKKI